MTAETISTCSAIEIIDFIAHKHDTSNKGHTHTHKTPYK